MATYYDPTRYASQDDVTALLPKPPVYPSLSGSTGTTSPTVTKPKPITTATSTVVPQTMATTQQQMADFFPASGGTSGTGDLSPTTPVTLPAAPVSSQPPVLDPGTTTPTTATIPNPANPLAGVPLGDAGLPNPPIVAGTPGSTMANLPTLPGTSVQPFGPGNDLRFDAVLPSPDVNRLDLANQYFDQYAESTDPAYQQALRQATQRAAANGIIGSGMLTNTYGDVATQRAQALDLARRGFLTDALQGTIQDAINNRNEVRTERDYQTQQAQQAIQDQITQLLLQDQLGGNDFERQLQLAQILGNLGYQGNPGNTLLAGSQSQQQSADQLYQMLGQLLYGVGQRSA